MTRRNRAGDSPEELKLVAAIGANPRLYTRAARREAGYRKPAWADLMRTFHSETLVYPRIVRRHIRAALQPVNRRRSRMLRARMARSLARYGVSL